VFFIHIPQPVISDPTPVLFAVEKRKYQRRTENCCEAGLAVRKRRRVNLLLRLPVRANVPHEQLQSGQRIRWTQEFSAVSLQIEENFNALAVRSDEYDSVWLWPYQF
jgi:hypothetical protein